MGYRRRLTRHGFLPGDRVGHVQLDLELLRSDTCSYSGRPHFNTDTKVHRGQGVAYQRFHPSCEHGFDGFHGR